MHLTPELESEAIMGNLLTVRDLHVRYHTDGADVYALNGINLDINRGEVVGLVGETGAGKSTLALSIMKLLPADFGEIIKGSICFDDINVTDSDNLRMQKLRGRRISMIFQDPMTSLNPTMTIGKQIYEVLKLHHPQMDEKEKWRRVEQVLQMVGIPPSRKNDYPHQFSGGMKQRVVIAISLVCEPELLIADEPTTALDVTIQAQILALMSNLRTELNTAMLLITHDLGIVAEFCDRVAVEYCGEIIEYGSVEDIFSKKFNHPYTEGLFKCIVNVLEKTERLTPIKGYMADPTDLPRGCKFADRCDYCTDKCRLESPDIYTLSNGHGIKCYRFQKGEIEI